MKKNSLRLVYLRPKDLKKNPRNWRKHPAAQAEALRSVMEETGWAGAILLNATTDRIIDGHLRIDEAIRRKDEKVPVLVGHWTEKQERLLLTSLDPLAAMAETDGAILKDLLSEIETEDDALKGMMDGLLDDANEALDAEREEVEEPVDPGELVDKAAELQKKWKVKTGDLFAIGSHRLLCGDSTKAEDMARLMGGGGADLVFTDPPYGINILGGGGPTKFKGTIGGGKIVAAGMYSPIHGDDRPFDPRWLFDLAPKQVIFGANYFCEKLPPRAGWIVWDKRNDGVRNDFADVELAFSSEDRPARIYRTVWMGMVKEGESGKRIHPTQKPVKLCADILADFTGAVVVIDPFLGSGTTMVACQNLKRKCRGIEISPAYCAVTLERMHNAFPKLKIKRLP